MKLFVNDKIFEAKVPGVVYQISGIDEVKRQYTCDRLFTSGSGEDSKVGTVEFSFEKVESEFNIVGGHKRWA